ncbi:MAG: Fumarylacetoacetate hydrolase [Acidimicrobiales bacterium]|nr:Fumarylacetoacetate hydrolase [Acidimicrobiales bacterium]
MRLANVGGRATIVVPGSDDRGVDVAEASGGELGPDPQDVYESWDAFEAFAADLDLTAEAPATFDQADLRAPVPAPRQVFGIGLNYRSHAAESGVDVPAVPATFTKFPASITGPFAEVELPNGTVDWEVELVVVIGRRADRVAAASGWSHVAGLTVGQDLSDRTLQFAAGGQFSLGKSHRGFTPFGPWVVTPDELDDPDDLALGCSIDGETVQDARTADLVFGVSQLVAELSAVVPLLPGDIIFTGTPAGVGFTRQPPRYLQPGETLDSWIEGIGTIRTRFSAPAGAGLVGGEQAGRPDAG